MIYKTHGQKQYDRTTRHTNAPTIFFQHFQSDEMEEGVKRIGGRLALTGQRRSHS